MSERVKKSKDGVRVMATKDGPYLVSGSVQLARHTTISDSEGNSESWELGKNYSPQENCALSVAAYPKTSPSVTAVMLQSSSATNSYGV